MITHEFAAGGDVLIVTPHGRLTAEDFVELARVVDPHIEERSGLRGMLIEAPVFPGWEDFAALVSHVKFVRGHHRDVRRVAVVTDSTFAGLLPSLADHFVKASIRHFPAKERDRALHWLREDD